MVLTLILNFFQYQKPCPLVKTRKKKYLVGWSISNTITIDFVVRAVEEAVRIHGKPEIINIDQGSQFTSKAYIDCIKSYETIKIS